MGIISMSIKHLGLGPISWIAYIRTLSRFCCMLVYIGSSMGIIIGCCRKDFLLQFIIQFLGMR